jgi:hypothetical protein
MFRITFQTKLWIFVIMALAVVLITTSNYQIPQLVAHKSKNNADKNQQHDLMECLDKSMQNLLNGDMNFSNADPISHCFDQPFKNKANNNGTNNGGGNNNDINNDSTFYNV